MLYNGSFDELFKDPSMALAKISTFLVSNRGILATIKEGKDINGETLVNTAAKHGHLGVMKLLISGQGFDVNLQGKDGKTPLHHAIERLDPLMTQSLLEQRADILKVDESGHTPFYFILAMDMQTFQSLNQDQISVLALAMNYSKKEVSIWIDVFDSKGITFPVYQLFFNVEYRPTLFKFLAHYSDLPGISNGEQFEILRKIVRKLYRSKENVTLAGKQYEMWTSSAEINLVLSQLIDEQLQNNKFLPGLRICLLSIEKVPHVFYKKAAEITQQFIDKKICDSNLSQEQKAEAITLAEEIFTEFNSTNQIDLLLVQANFYKSIQNWDKAYKIYEHILQLPSQDFQAICQQATNRDAILFYETQGNKFTREEISYLNQKLDLSSEESNILRKVFINLVSTSNLSVAPIRVLIQKLRPLLTSELPAQISERCVPKLILFVELLERLELFANHNPQTIKDLINSEVAELFLNGGYINSEGALVIEDSESGTAESENENNRKERVLCIIQSVSKGLYYVSRSEHYEDFQNKSQHLEKNIDKVFLADRTHLFSDLMYTIEHLVNDQYYVNDRLTFFFERALKECNAILADDSNNPKLRLDASLLKIQLYMEGLIGRNGRRPIFNKLTALELLSQFRAEMNTDFASAVQTAWSSCELITEGKEYLKILNNILKPNEIGEFISFFCGSHPLPKINDDLKQLFAHSVGRQALANCVESLNDEKTSSEEKEKLKRVIIKLYMADWVELEQLADYALLVAIINEKIFPVGKENQLTADELTNFCRVAIKVREDFLNNQLYIYNHSYQDTNLLESQAYINGLRLFQESRTCTQLRQDIDLLVGQIYLNALIQLKKGRTVSELLSQFYQQSDLSQAAMKAFNCILRFGETDRGLLEKLYGIFIPEFEYPNIDFDVIDQICLSFEHIYHARLKQLISFSAGKKLFESCNQALHDNSLSSEIKAKARRAIVKLYMTGMLEIERIRTSYAVQFNDPELKSPQWKRIENFLYNNYYYPHYEPGSLYAEEKLFIVELLYNRHFHELEFRVAKETCDKMLDELREILVNPSNSPECQKLMEGCPELQAKACILIVELEVDRLNERNIIYGDTDRSLIDKLNGIFCKLEVSSFYTNRMNRALANIILRPKTPNLSYNYGSSADIISHGSFFSSQSNSRAVFSQPNVQLPEGLTYQAVPGDGHCLYHAVGLYLGKDQQVLRREVAQLIRENSQDYAEYIRALEPGKSVEDYLQRLEGSNEWADHLEIAILMKILKRPIVIIEEVGNIRNRQDINDERLDMANPIFVFYNGDTHYDALLLSNAAPTTGEVILQRLLENSAPQRRVGLA